MMRRRKRNSIRTVTAPSRPPLSKFARRLLKEWRSFEFAEQSATVIVGVSGGADSVALWLALDELVAAAKLKIKIVVAHLDHQLRGRASRADARWVATLGKRVGHRVVVGQAQVAERAAKARDNLEQAARRSRYDFFERTAKTRKAQLVLTAHTMDDQVETVLLNLMRGSGAEGLSGIQAVRRLKTGSKIVLFRPLINWARREDTEEYCRQRSIEFRMDATNADETFARVRVRRRLLPLMNSFNPRLVEAVVRTAEVLREDNRALEGAAAHLLQLSLNGDGKRARQPNRLYTDLLALAPPALRRRALRLWLAMCRGDLRRLERSHILAVDTLVLGVRGERTIELPRGRVVKKSGCLNYSAAAK